MKNRTKAMLLPFLRDSAGVNTSATACGIRLDISRQRLSADDFKRLLELAESKGLVGAGFQNVLDGFGLGALDEAAGVHQNDIGLRQVGHRLMTGRQQDVHHHIQIHLIFRAAKGNTRNFHRG